MPSKSTALTGAQLTFTSRMTIAASRVLMSLHCFMIFFTSILLLQRQKALRIVQASFGLSNGFQIYLIKSIHFFNSVSWNGSEVRLFCDFMFLWYNVVRESLRVRLENKGAPIIMRLRGGCYVRKSESGGSRSRFRGTGSY